MKNKSHIGSGFLLSCPFLKQFVNAKLWKRKWQPTPIFLLGESHGQRSLVGYSPWSHKELDTIEATSILKELSPGISLEGMMLKLKL